MHNGVPHITSDPRGRLHYMPNVIPPETMGWTCIICEEKVSPFQFICPHCGLTPEEAFEVACAVEEDLMRVVPEQRDPIEDIQDKEHLGG